MIPRIRLTDPAFRYVPSHLTCIAETFKRVLQAQRVEAQIREQQKMQEAEDTQRVVDIFSERRK